MIYRNLLSHNGPIGELIDSMDPRRDHSGLHPMDPRRNHSGLHPKVLRTCHQVLSEARIVLYRENVFRIHIHNRMETGAELLALEDRFRPDRILKAKTILQAKAILGLRFQRDEEVRDIGVDR